MSRGKVTSPKSAPSHYYILLGATIFLLLLGVIVVFSASSVMAYARFKDSYYFIKRQALWSLVGILGMYIFANLDYRRLKKLAVPGVICAVVLLGLVLAVGKVAGGASRWLILGPLSVQPSELAKLAVILFAAQVYARKRNELGDLGDLIVPVGLVAGLIFGLVLLQPDLGTAFTIVLSVYILMFAGGAKLRHLLGMGSCGAIAIAIFIFSEDYRRQRFLAFLNPWADPRRSGYHIIQSLLALGTGGVKGVGLGMSRQKFGFLPAAHTDFVFPIIGEELGLAGTLLVVVLFGVLAYAGMRTAMKAPDKFGSLLATGITCLVLSQAIINMGAVTGILPITGIPLPLISFGGSSIVLTLSAIGIMLNIAYQKNRKSLGLVVDSRTSADRATAATSAGPRVKANQKPRRARRSNMDESNENHHLRRRNGGPRLSGIGSRRSPRI